MKRDMDLVRKILFALEASDNIGPDNGFHIEGYGDGVVGYHLMLMGEAGLLIAVDARSMGNRTAMMPVRLTWAGHEFLEAGRNDQRWGTAKSITAKLGNASLDVFTSVLTELAKQQLAKILPGVI